MAKMQEEMGTKTIEASAGGGMVKVVANGRQEIISFILKKKWWTRKMWKCSRI